MTGTQREATAEAAGSRGRRWATVATRRFGRRLAITDLTAAVHARTMGDGADVVIVPGLAVSAYLYETQERLAALGRVHLLELPGVAGGRDVPGTPTLRDDAAAVTEWLRTRLRRPAIVVGHSYGTQVAVRTAAADDTFVAGLVLASPTVDPRYRSLRRLLWAWRADARTHPEGLVEVNRPQQRRAGLGRVCAMGVSMLADAPERWLAQVAVPLTVMVGSRDALGTEAWGRRLTDRPNGRYVRVEGGTHTFPFECPEALVRTVRVDMGKDTEQ
ncbi:MAG: alpha/beta fold hydrolase [Streptosporangiales bacterium]|nr:alpha/beta fold hydrolase [Streptosporangiales bacterium]